MALALEPGNWLVKTRVSLAHYLKVSVDYCPPHGPSTTLPTALEHVSLQNCQRPHGMALHGREASG